VISWFTNLCCFTFNLYRYLQVNIGDTDSLVANKDITQVVEVCGGFQKQTRLMDILRNPPMQPLKAIVFCGTKRMCDQLGRSMGGMGGVIHGDKEQRERDYVLNQFRQGRVPVLIATDVAARGLDIDKVNMVVNFDFPNQIEDYVHRIGRTGRAGNKGCAHSFIDPGEGNMAKKLINIMREAGQRVEPELEEMAARGGGGGGRPY
jgi:ATP-dependent RNA helicase DDX5/DBP2